jgi:glutamate-1-semialdehyde aminotransferase
MVKNYRKSRRLFSKAVEMIPGGVNSPVRAFKAFWDMLIHQ